MRHVPWAVLLAYTAAVFLSLPRTRALVAWSEARFGPEAQFAAAGSLVALAVAVLAGRLLHAREAFPWPHLALAALARWRWTGSLRT